MVGITPPVERVKALRRESKVHEVKAAVAVDACRRQLVRRVVGVDDVDDVGGRGHGTDVRDVVGDDGEVDGVQKTNGNCSCDDLHGVIER